MSLIIPANSAAAAGGYQVDNSCRFNSGSSDYLSFIPNATSNQKTWTVSCWVKRSTLGSNQYVWGVNGDTSGHYFTELLFNSSDQLEFRQGGTVGDPYQTQYITNRLFRDVSAWSNIVIAADTTDSTEADRLKIWINGVQETSFATTNHPSLNENYRWHFVSGSNYPHSIGRSGRHNTNYFGGYIAEWIDVDGSQLAADSFGEFDEDSGIWKPIDVSDLTLGTNGAYLDFEDSSALGNSSNSNNYTANNLTAIDQSTDTCTTNFCTLNPLWVSSNTYSEGNTKVAGGSAHRPNMPTFAPNAGKWYMEAKILSGNSNRWWIGYADQEFYDTLQNVTSNLNWGGGNTAGGTNQINVSLNNGWSNQLNLYPNSAITSFFSSSSQANDIIAIAVDLDNQKAWWSQNGVWRNGSATASTTFNASYPDTTQLDAGRNYYIATGSENSTWSVNYGNPAYAISSGNTDGNGYGNFEYAVPSGYLSLCTKNLSEVLG